MAIIRHEVGHVVFSHVKKIMLGRIIYYCILLEVISYFIFTRENWLAMFGIENDSLFIALFIVMHFFHFKFSYYIFEIIERAL